MPVNSQRTHTHLPVQIAIPTAQGTEPKEVSMTESSLGNIQLCNDTSQTPGEYQRQNSGLGPCRGHLQLCPKEWLLPDMDLLLIVGLSIPTATQRSSGSFFQGKSSFRDAANPAWDRNVRTSGPGGRNSDHPSSLRPLSRAVHMPPWNCCQIPFSSSSMVSSAFPSSFPLCSWQPGLQLFLGGSNDLVSFPGAKSACCLRSHTDHN